MRDGGETAAAPAVVPAVVPRALLGRFLVARFAGGAAMQMQVVAVGWLVYAVTESALALGLIGLTQFCATLSLALPAGHVVDHFNRRSVMLAAFLVEALAASGLAALVWRGDPPIAAIFGLVALYGAARAFDHPASAALLPLLVPGRGFPRAVAYATSANQAAVLLGPALGGLLYAVGPAVPFLSCAGALLLGAGALLLVPRPMQQHQLGAPSLARLLGGIAFVRRNPVVLGTISLDLFGVLFGGATALLPIYARDILAIGPLGLGLLRSAPAIGALAMALVLTRRPPRRGVGRVMLWAVAAFGLATITFGLSRSLPLSLLALAAAGAADMISMVVRSTMVQTETPDELRGRVSAVNALFIGTSNQLGEFESGALAAWLGPVGSVVLGGLATLAVVALWSRLFPALRRLDRLSL